MTGQDEQDERVRALLSDLGGETMPPDVAARLDATLADLVAERAPAQEPAQGPAREAEVVPLRARWLPTAAAAAAAIVVLGGVGVATGTFRAVTEGAGSAQSAKTADSGGGGSSAEEPAAPTDSDGKALLSGAPELSSAGFAGEVTRLLRGQDTRAPAQDGVPSPEAARSSCPGPRVTDGSTLSAIRLDGRPAVLVVHPVSGGARLVEAWSCAGGTRLASARVAP